MSNVCVYSFADATGLTKYVDSQGDFLFTGTWSSGGTYTATPLMAAQYGAAYYMAIRDNVGDNPQRIPTRTRPSSWSIMSLLYEYQCGSGTLTPAEALAEAAWELAQSGTNIAWAAYYLAQIGTNTGSAAYDLAGTAYALAGSAYDLAGSAATDAATALSTANGAFSVAVVAESVANQAYALAQIGTNTGTAALNAAATAQSTASSAFNIAVAGTNIATTGSNLAWQAFELAQTGTDLLVIEQGTRAQADQNLQNQINLLSGGTVSFDNPTAEVGLSHVNGSGTTAMRSTSAPRLSQAIAPTWSGYHAFTRGLAVPTLAAVNLTAPNTYLMTDSRGAITLSSDGTAWADREFTLAAGNREGHEMTLVWTGTGLAEMLNNAEYAGCRVRLQSDYWHPTLYATMMLRFNGTDWLEMSRTPLVLATSGSSTANVAQAAYALAQIGTNTGTAAYDLAQIAYNTAVSASGSASGSVAIDAYLLAVSGTNQAQEAYRLAQIGTNTGTAAYDLATAAYALAQQGTITTVGSVPYAGTIYFDFAGSDYQQTTVNGALAVNAVNYTTGAEIAVLLLSTGTTWPLYMAGSISATTWFGTTPPPQIYNKDVILALTCLSDSPVALIGAPSVEA